MKAWTEGYFPWTMGGSIHRPVMADLQVLGPYDGGKGISLYVAMSPAGRTAIIEGQCGAVVGDDFKTVLADIAEADPGVMERQVEAARRRLEEAGTIENVEPERFWQLYR